MPCSPNKINEFVEVLSHRVKEIIRAMGFGGLLKLKAKELNRKATVWLMDIFNPNKMKLQIGGGKEITVDEFAVSCVFGLPNAGVDPPLLTDTIRNEGAEIWKELSKKLYGVEKAITVTSLKEMIRKKEINDDLALRCFFMVAFSNLLYTNTESIIWISDVVWTEDIG